MALLRPMSHPSPSRQLHLGTFTSGLLPCSVTAYRGLLPPLIDAKTQGQHAPRASNLRVGEGQSASVTVCAACSWWWGKHHSRGTGFELPTADTAAIQFLHFYTLQGESVLAELARQI